jgi:hypothetical protein
MDDLSINRVSTIDISTIGSSNILVFNKTPIDVMTLII